MNVGHCIRFWKAALHEDRPLSPRISRLADWRRARHQRCAGRRDDLVGTAWLHHRFERTEQQQLLVHDLWKWLFHLSGERRHYRHPDHPQSGRQPRDIAGEYMVTQFHSRSFPHPDPDFKAQGQKCDVVFRKYTNNVITYEVLGPVAPRAVGERVNKFGKTVPERYTWVDPRTGEQIVRQANGQYTPVGSRLRQFMMKQKVNKSNQWDTWIDRDFVAQGELLNDNPWGSM